ncbi:MAG: type I restriction enzyme HsdR N-terminal domain-containing protein [Methanothrix sp.]
MDFADKIKEIALHMPEKLPNIQSEETTKIALILPFIQALGYDIFDPTEVKGELTLDMGGVKADRIDYAIFKNNEAKILIECKSCDVDIRKATFKQLKKYFAFTNAKFGILTNGIKYRFFSDLENTGKMDDVPFLELDMMKVNDSIVAVIKNFSNPMDEEKASEIANELKCKGEIRAILEREFNKPSKEFVLFFASQIHKGSLVKSVVKQFCGYTKETCDQFIQDKIDVTFEAAGYQRRQPLIPTPEPPEKEKYFIFNGERNKIRFWKDMLPKVCSIMASRHKERLEEIFTIKGDKYIYFSRNQVELKSPELIDGTDIFVETNYAKGMLLKIARDVVTLFDYPEDIVSFGEDQE